MGASDPAFYYYPDPDGTLEIIDLGEDMSDIQERSDRRVTDAYDGGMTFQRVVHGGVDRVRLVLENFTTAATERALRTMTSHLERGGYVGFTANQAKTFAGFKSSSGSWDRGLTGILVQNAFTSWASAGTLAASDEITIESVNPEHLREANAVSTVAGSTFLLVTLSTALDMTFDATLVNILRYRWFWPMLRLPEDQLGSSPITDDHRIAYTLDVELEYDLNAVAALVEDGMRGIGLLGGGGLSLGDTSVGAVYGGRQRFGSSPKKTTRRGL